MILLSYVMKFSGRIAGVIAQSGAILSDIGLKINATRLKDKSIIITPDLEDAAMPISRGRETRGTLVSWCI